MAGCFSLKVNKVFRTKLNKNQLKTLLKYAKEIKFSSNNKQIVTNSMEPDFI